MVDLKKKVRKGTGKVAFLAHLDGIRKMIEAGHPMISVFEEYESKMTVKEQQFGKYVRKYIRRKPEEKTEGNRTEVKAKVSSSRQSRDSALENLKSPTNKEDIV